MLAGRLKLVRVSMTASIKIILFFSIFHHIFVVHPNCQRKDKCHNPNKIFIRRFKSRNLFQKKMNNKTVYARASNDTTT